jgi:hypothetical protein
LYASRHLQAFGAPQICGASRPSSGGEERLQLVDALNELQALLPASSAGGEMRPSIVSVAALKSSVCV